MGFPKDWEDNEEVFQYQGLQYISEIIYSKLISYHHNNLLVKHFEIDKIQELIIRKYFWLTFCHNIKTDIRGCDICLAYKALCYKFNRDL